tara:strand:- start:2253 stop:2855 length:603 start_codon:yes stop_codon:yes gene_type:complete
LKNKLNDKEIIKGLLSNNGREENAALAVLYKELKIIVKNIVLENSGSNDDIDDVLQDGIMTLYSNLVLSKRIIVEDYLIRNKAGNIVKLSTYMYAVFRNTWFTKLRDKKWLSDKDVSEIKILYEENDVYKQETEFERKVDLILKGIDTMGKKCKEILTLFWLERKRYKEIAKIMGHENADVSKATKSRCQRELKIGLNVN